MKHNETVIMETGKYYRLNNDDIASVANVFLVVHQDIGNISYRMYDPTDKWHSSEFTRKRHNFPCVRPYYNYAQQQINAIIEPATEYEYSIVVHNSSVDNKHTNFMKVSREQVEKIRDILAD